MLIKMATLFVLALAPWLACAEASLRVPDLCYEGAGCNSQMQEIFRRFQSLSQPPQVASMPKVLSGECYYMGFGTDPDHLQYGVALLDKQGEQPVYSGLLTFFYESNEFASWSVEAARINLKKGGSIPTAMTIREDLAEVEFASATSLIQYWLREDPISHEVIQVSRWLFKDYALPSQVFCRFSPNSAGEALRR